ncbi:MAG: acyl-CoA thioesterase [Desulfuromonadaceae bacterium]|nr:acyl-CoA thioesterase [Desulfuromonadaceae bacterium]MDF1580651.1 thioesterase family protein [Desulfuromonadales bacterium]MDT8422860.1 thioesterase family protein [Desulfuromonadales bacterium]
MTEIKKYSIPVELRFADLDAYGHVNNAVYFTLLETARTKLFHDKFIEFMGQSLLFLVAKAECEYKLPIGLDDVMIITLEIARVGNSSFDIDYVLHNGDGKLFGLAKTVMVCYDGKAKKPTRIPKSLKQMMLAD